MRGRVEKWERFRSRAKDLTELAQLAGDDPGLDADVSRELVQLAGEVG